MTSLLHFGSCFVNYISRNWNDLTIILYNLQNQDSKENCQAARSFPPVIYFWGNGAVQKKKKKNFVLYIAGKIDTWSISIPLEK